MMDFNELKISGKAKSLEMEGAGGRKPHRESTTNRWQSKLAFRFQ